MQFNKRSPEFQRYLDRQSPERNVELSEAERRFAAGHYEKLRTHESLFEDLLSGRQDTPAGTPDSSRGNYVHPEFQTDTAMNEPEVQLWGAVLMQAKADLASSIPALRKDAAGWFAAEEDAVGGFGWICDLLRIDPSAVRLALPGLHTTVSAAA
jgi:hypothetical protein